MFPVSFGAWRDTNVTRKKGETVDSSMEIAAQGRARQEADALIALADERKAAAAPEQQQETDDIPPNGETGEPPLKRKPVISIMGTDKTTGERVMLHRARSKRAARKWALGCSFMLLRLYYDLTVAVTREEALI